MRSLLTRNEWRSWVSAAFASMASVSIFGAVGDGQPSPAVPSGHVSVTADQQTETTMKAIREAYSRLPLAFVPNEGQTHDSVRLYAHGTGFRLAFLRGEALFAFTKTARGETKGAVLSLRFLGGRRDATPEGGQPGMGRVNYLIGNDPRQWRTNLPTYGEVIYRNLWRGIDLVFRGADGQLKYEFVLRPGAEVSNIRLAYAGAKHLSLDAEGNLLLETPLGTLTDARPLAYQESHGQRLSIASRYRLGPKDSYGFAIGAYDRSRSVVIDPGLLYSTYLGGSGTETGVGIAVDVAGQAYVTGSTSSADFPTTPGAFQTTHKGGEYDAFITKLNPGGSAPLIYTTYLGGKSFDFGGSIAIDAAGNAYVAGGTISADFPTTSGAFDTTSNGGGRRFRSKAKSRRFGAIAVLDLFRRKRL